MQNLYNTGDSAGSLDVTFFRRRVYAQISVSVYDACSSTQQWTKLHYTRPYHHSSSTTHSTRVFVLTTHLRGGCNRDPFGCWFLMLFTHQTLFSLCVYGQSKPGGLLFASFLSTFRRTEPFSDSPHPVYTKQHSEFGMVHRCAGFTLTLQQLAHSSTGSR